MRKKAKELLAEIRARRAAEMDAFVDEMELALEKDGFNERLEKEMAQWRKDNPDLVEADKKLLEKQAKLLKQSK